jgi:hypothetical protein
VIPHPALVPVDGKSLPSWSVGPFAGADAGAVRTVNSLVAEPATNHTPAPPASAIAHPQPASPENEPAAEAAPPPRPSIGPLSPPRSDTDLLLHRCDRLRLR